MSPIRPLTSSKLLFILAAVAVLAGCDEKTTPTSAGAGAEKQTPEQQLSSTFKK